MSDPISNQERRPSGMSAEIERLRNALAQSIETVRSLMRPPETEAIPHASAALKDFMAIKVFGQSRPVPKREAPAPQAQSNQPGATVESAGESRVASAQSGASLLGSRIANARLEVLERRVKESPTREERDIHILRLCAEQLENYSFHEYGKELRRIANHIDSSFLHGRSPHASPALESAAKQIVSMVDKWIATPIPPGYRDPQQFNCPVPWAYINALRDALSPKLQTRCTSAATVNDATQVPELPTRCPNCGAQLQRFTSYLHCPACATDIPLTSKRAPFLVKSLEATAEALRGIDNDQIRELMMDAANELRGSEKEVERLREELRQSRIELARTAAKALRTIWKAAAASPASEPNWRAEVESVLNHLGPDAIRVREGGGMENILASLAVSVSKLQSTARNSNADFKNFHRQLCERFDYTHDERDWKRDQVSLIEHIAGRLNTEYEQIGVLNGSHSFTTNEGAQGEPVYRKKMRVRTSTPSNRPLHTKCPKCRRDHPECGKPMTEICYYYYPFDSKIQEKP